ncbi:Crp/Fnr family transcriptional regulator [Rhodovulum sp. DZ06]|uniref:Crp/Fnr family transcriptional regulator n=1 Tax=Rhodovulum sp. DZ06 TaxID=3425126 RepID=UPI003D33C4BC
MMDFSVETTELLGFLAAGAVFLTFCMRTMLSLRIVAVISNMAFLVYALKADLIPILALHGTLLPMNLWRLLQLLRQVRAVGAADPARSTRDGFGFLAPYGDARRVEAGDVLFRKGDAAGSMFVVVRGEVRLPELGIELGPGALLGEIGLFTGEGLRTVSAEAVGPVVLSEVTERNVRELYFDNPEFAYRLIRLIASRLAADLRIMEERIADGAS